MKARTAPRARKVGAGLRREARRKFPCRQGPELSGMTGPTILRIRPEIDLYDLLAPVLF